MDLGGRPRRNASRGGSQHGVGHELRRAGASRGGAALTGRKARSATAPRRSPPTRSATRSRTTRCITAAIRCGGYPFSNVWHGWPVSDCTAEAMLALLDARAADVSDHDVALAAGFMLRAQGDDGGFGSYERKRVPFSIEWLNPAEMFGDSMTEAGYVECTASCVAALARIAEERPHLLCRAELAAHPRFHRSSGARHPPATAAVRGLAGRVGGAIHLRHLVRCARSALGRSAIERPGDSTSVHVAEEQAAPRR